MQYKSETSRIAKNTAVLYVRTLLIMIISLYTSRVILKALGVVDFGIYNVVGGLVILFAFLDGSQSGTYQRFYNYAMGRPDKYSLKNVFVQSLNVQIILAVFLTLLIESVGLYMLYYKLLIPADRLNAAFWVFQFSAVTLVVNTLSIPYNSFIIASEDLSAFAYIDIFNIILKLLIVLALEYLSFDRLVSYSFLLLLVQLLTRFVYTLYCKKKYKESSYSFTWDCSLIKEMFIFSSWILLSSIASILLDQGISILYNISFGVIVNAALSIGNQVRGAVLKLTSNLAMSFGPQIVINYANGEWCKVEKLWTLGSKCTLAFFASISIPIIIDSDYIMKIWLNNPPQYSSLFVRLILIENLFRFFSSNASTIVRATGNIKRFEIITNMLNIVAFLLIYLSFQIELSLTLPYVILILVTVFQVIYSICVACKNIHYSVKRYFLSNSLLSFVALFIGFSLAYIIMPETFSILKLFFHCILSFSLVLSVMYFIGFLSSERAYLNTTIYNLISKIWKK